MQRFWRADAAGPSQDDGCWYRMGWSRMRTSRDVRPAADTRAWKGRAWPEAEGETRLEQLGGLSAGLSRDFTPWAEDGEGTGWWVLRD